MEDVVRRLIEHNILPEDIVTNPRKMMENIKYDNLVINDIETECIPKAIGPFIAEEISTVNIPANDTSIIYALEKKEENEVSNVADNKNIQNQTQIDNQENQCKDSKNNNNIKDNNHNTIREKAVFSLLELQELLAKDKEWHRQMTVYFELQHLKPPDDFLPYFQEFFVHLGAKGYKEREETECKSHFHSWLNKKLQRQPIYDTQQPTTNQCSQRRGTPVAAKSAADYEGAF